MVTEPRCSSRLADRDPLKRPARPREQASPKRDYRAILADFRVNVVGVVLNVCFTRCTASIYNSQS